MKSNEKMVRKQVYLSPSQNEKLKKMSDLSHKSEAEIIREAIEEYHAKQITPPNTDQSLSNLIGLIHEPIPDGSTQHDESIYLDEQGTLDE